MMLCLTGEFIMEMAEISCWLRHALHSGAVCMVPNSCSNATPDKWSSTTELPFNIMRVTSNTIEGEEPFDLPTLQAFPEPFPITTVWLLAALGTRETRLGAENSLLRY